MQKKYFFFVLLAISCCLNTYAQLSAEIKFDKLTVNDGLSSNAVITAFEDSRGFIWLATENGLNRFDGKHIKVYKHDSLNTNSINGNFITNIFEDKDGMLWISCFDKGICRFNPYTETFKQYKHDSLNSKSLAEGYINVALQDTKGRIWIAIWGSGIDLYNPNTDDFTHFRKNKNQPDGILTNHVKDIKQDKNGLLWFTCWNSGGDGELQCLNPDTREFTIIDRSNIVSPDGKPIPSGGNGLNLIHKVYIDNEENIWYATYLGVYKYVPSEKKFYRYFSDENDKTGISFNNVRSIVQDKFGDIWMGSLGGGLNRFNPKTGKFTVYNFNFKNSNSISDNLIRGIYIDKKDRIWIGTYTAGINIINPLKQEFQLIHNDTLQVEFSDKSSQTNKISSFTIAPNNILYVLSGAGLTAYNYQTNTLLYTYKKIENYYRRMQTICFNQNIYIYGWNGFLKYNTRNQSIKTFRGINDPHLPNQIYHPTAIFTTTDGKLAIGSHSKGLGFMDANTDEIIYPFSEILSKPITAVNTKLSSLNIIGTESDGLFIYNKKFELIKQIKIDSLPLPNTPTNNQINAIFQDIKNNVWVLTQKNIFFLDTISLTLKPNALSSIIKDENVIGINDDRGGNVWISTVSRLFKYNIETGRFLQFDASLGMFSRAFERNIEEDENGYLFLNTSDGILKFNPNNLVEPTQTPPLFISSVRLFGVEYFSDSAAFVKRNYVFKYNQNSIAFEFACAELTNHNKVIYYYQLTEDYNDTTWINSANNTLAIFNNLSAGEYIFRVKCINAFGLVSYSNIVHIKILPPFWQTWWFYILCALAFLFVVYMYIKFRERKLNAEKIKLETIVHERTAEVVSQKEIIQEKNKELTDSINYAKRLQFSILPPAELVNEYFKENFILYKPKDIVAGDFYWMEVIDNKIYFAVADCTGHGVPGAMVSVVCSIALTRAVKEFSLNTTGEILDKTRELVLETFSKSSNDVKDGMDISFVCIDEANKKIQWSGANNSIWYVQNNQLHVLKADKQPIGNSYNSKPFTTSTINIHKGLIIYLFTDGYADQFGGPKGKKFKYSQLSDLISQHIDKSMAEQYKILDRTFEEWRGSLEQIDDVCIVGIKF